MFTSYMYMRTFTIKEKAVEIDDSKEYLDFYIDKGQQQLAKLDIVKLLLKHGAKVNTRRFMVIKWATEWGRAEILQYLLDTLDKTGEMVGEKALTDWIHWSNTSDKIEDGPRKEIAKILEARKKKEKEMKK